MPLQYTDLLHFVQSLLPGMRLTRQRNLVWLILGIVQTRDAHLTVSEIARAIPTHSAHWHKLKRMWRFLSNMKWTPSDHFPDLFAFVLARFRVNGRVPIIIDQSTIGGRWEVLWASLPFRGRALPICFRVFRYADIRRQPDSSQTQFEHQFIREVVQLVPPSLAPLLLLDRGYARVSLVRLLQSLAVDYVIRTKADTWVYDPTGYVGLLRAVKVRRGQLLWWPKVRYHQREHFPTNVVITLNAVAEEPWYLLTSLKRASQAVFWYERRFRCEELFRDLKDQLQLETIRVTTAPRIERLLFGLVVAYLALSLIGVAAKRAGLNRKVCKDRTSSVWMALRLLYMPHFLKPRLVRRALLLYRWSLLYESG